MKIDSSCTPPAAFEMAANSNGRSEGRRVPHPLVLRQYANEVLFEHLDGGLGVADAPELKAGVATAVLHEDLGAARVLKEEWKLEKLRRQIEHPAAHLAEELREVVDLVEDHHPTLVLGDLFQGDDLEGGGVVDGDDFALGGGGDGVGIGAVVDRGEVDGLCRAAHDDGGGRLSSNRRSNRDSAGE